MTYFSPNVVAREFDFSDYAVRGSGAILGVVGTSTKGPVNTPTLITNERELIDTFGYPKTSVTGAGDVLTSNMILPALQFLREGNQMVVVRVDADATAGTLAIEDDNSSTEFMTVTAISPGTWTDASEENLQIVASATVSGSENYDYFFDLEVWHRGSLREKFTNLTVNTDIDPDGDHHPETIVNGNSLLITVNVTATTSGTTKYIPALTATSLSGATNGTTDVGDYTAADSGLSLLSDPELININILITPGVTQQFSDTSLVVVTAALQMCESRQDCIYVMDPTWTASTYEKARNVINGTGADGFSTPLNSSYGAYYSPWLSVYDAYNKVQVWMPPSGTVAAQYAFNDREAQMWFAPAGLNRGRLRLVSGVQFNYRREHLEIVQGPRECVNPIRNIVGQGIVIWGQKTLQRKASALDRVNVRRMLNYAKRAVINASQVLLFEQNTPKLWRKFTQLATPIIQQIKDTQGLYDFRVICDETTNPPALIDQNMMQGKILLKPTKTAEIITVDFNVLSTGASFNEFV